MTVTKTPIDPTRIRQLPIGGFSWINRRFIRGGYIKDLPREAITLYFFLATVADANGMSFYADPTTGKLLKLDQSELLYGRDQLLRADIIAYRYPLYQVLALPVKRQTRKKPNQRTSVAKNGEPVAIAACIDDVLARAGPRPPLQQSE